MKYHNQNKVTTGRLTHHKVVVFKSHAYFFGGLKPDGKGNKEIFMYDIDYSKFNVVNATGLSIATYDEHTCNVYQQTMVMFGGFQDEERSN